MTWKEYENKVLEYFTAKHPNHKIGRNIKLKGRLSKTPREIDILLSTVVFGCSLEIAIECKNWNTKLDVADIGAFIDKLHDVGISKGIIISKKGYSEAAYNRARTEVNVQLQVLDFENIPKIHGFWGYTYRGNLGALLSAPNGWIINNDVPENMRIDMLCFFHPMEYTFEVAAKKKHLMWFQIFPIIEDLNLTKTLKNQDERVKINYPNSKIKYWKEGLNGGTVLYRQIDYIKENYTEFTAGVESEDFFAYCICIMPSDYNSDDIARIKYVIQEMHLLKLNGVDPTNSHKDWKEFFNTK